jgi:hypothetical protein
MPNYGEWLSNENLNDVEIHYLDWKYWEFKISKKPKEKTYVIDCDDIFKKYFKTLFGYRKLEKAQKVVDNAIRDFIRYIKTKEEIKECLKKD